MTFPQDMMESWLELKESGMIRARNLVEMFLEASEKLFHEKCSNYDYSKQVRACFVETPKTLQDQCTLN